jgi:hypothetical protein
MEEGTLPHHAEYEQGIIGAIINEPRLYDAVSADLLYTDFYVQRHKWIFAVIGEMIEGGIPVGLVTLWERLQNTGELENAGGSVYLTYLAECAFLEENLGYYVGVVKSDSRLRKLWEIFVEGARAVERGGDAGEVERIIGKLSQAETAPPGRRLKPVPAPELRHIQPPPSIWADVLYPKCITQLNSEPGAGKSTLAYNICGLGAAGQPFLGIPFSKRLKSLYVDLETPDFLVRHKIELISGGLPPDLHVLDNLDLREDFRELLRLCRDEKYDLVVLDTQSRALAMEKENDNAEANYMAGLLKQIARETGCAILMIHHSTKSDEGKAVYRGRGASAIAGAVDVVVNVDVLTDDTLRMSVEKNRIQQSSAKLYIRKAGEDRFEPCESRENREEPGFAIYRVQDAIVELLTKSSAPLRTGEIAQAVRGAEGVDERTIFRALGRLAQAGKIQKPRKGYYEVRNGSQLTN